MCLATTVTVFSGRLLSCSAQVRPLTPALYITDMIVIIST